MSMIRQCTEGTFRQYKLNCGKATKGLRFPPDTFRFPLFAASLKRFLYSVDWTRIRKSELHQKSASYIFSAHVHNVTVIIE